MHSSLDIVEERLAMGYRMSATAPPDCFLGLLYLSEGYRVYGSASNTKCVFLVVISHASGSGGREEEEEARKVLALVQTAYANVVCNPFYDVGSPIQSRKFSVAVAALISSPSTSSVLPHAT